MSKKLKFTPKEFTKIVEGGNPKYTIISNKILEHGVWMQLKCIVIKDTETGKFFKSIYSYSEGYLSNSKFKEVFPKEVTIREKVIIKYE